MRNLLPITITALAGTVSAGLLVTQTPMLSTVGNDDYGKREEDTPGVHLVDDEDDNDTGKDAGVPSRASRDLSRSDVSREIRNSEMSRGDRSDDRAPAPGPAPADASSDWSSNRSNDRSSVASND